ncbi:MAG: hypothetical protein LAT61_02450 [Alcanivorax sp.]|nr:hypothetical protein [Alcanivorax sp.]
MIDPCPARADRARVRVRMCLASLATLLLAACGGGTTIETDPPVQTHTLTYLTGNGGTLQGDTTQTLSHGDAGQPVTALPAVGHHFVDWSDGRTDNPRTDEAVTAPLSVTAQFAINRYTLTYSAAAGGTVTGALQQTLDHGQNGTSVTAVASTGYLFVQWDDGVTANPRTDNTVTTDMAAQAEFALDALQLAVGEIHFARLESGSIRIAHPDDQPGDYLLVPMNTSRDARKLDIVLSLIGNVDTGPATSLPALTPPTPDHAGPRDAHKQDAEARRGLVGDGTPLPDGAGIQTGVPEVGEQWIMNVAQQDACTVPVLTDATVRAIGTHVIILEDDNNPAGGFPLTGISSYETIIQRFDDTVYPAVTGLLGDLPDHDGNGRLILFFTHAINQIATTPYTNVSARYLIRDRLSPAECPGSNAGEVIYAMTPDPSATAAGILSTIESRATTAMALMIIDDQRLLAGLPLQDGWLESLTGNMAIEAGFYRESAGLAPLDMINLATLTTGPDAGPRVSTFNRFPNLMFGHLRRWMQSPWRTGLEPTPEEAGTARGLGWMFGRYVADRLAHAAGTPASAAVAQATFHSLAHSGEQGWAALDAVIGDDSERWLRDFLLALYLNEELVPPLATLPADLAMHSWDLRSVYSGLGGMPLYTRHLAHNESLPVGLAGAGGTLYARFRIAAEDSVDLTLDVQAESGQQGWYAVVRLP